MAKTDEPTELLSALESIKGLLEKSEIKLNAAKESVRLAVPKPLPKSPLVKREEEKARKAKEARAIPELEVDLDIPELGEDLVIPELDEIVVPATRVGAKPTVDMEVLKAFLDEMQKNIEKTMRDKLMKAVVSAEQDVKKQLAAYLDQLRKMMDG